MKDRSKAGYVCPEVARTHETAPDVAPVPEVAPEVAREVYHLTRVLVTRGCTAEVARQMPMGIWALAAGKARTRVPCARVRDLVTDQIRALESTRTEAPMNARS